MFINTAWCQVSWIEVTDLELNTDLGGLRTKQKPYHELLNSTAAKKEHREKLE